MIELKAELINIILLYFNFENPIKATSDFFISFLINFVCMPQHSQVPTQIYNRFFLICLKIWGSHISLRETKCTTNCLLQRGKEKKVKVIATAKTFLLSMNLTFILNTCFGNTLKGYILNLPFYNLKRTVKSKKSPKSSTIKHPILQGPQMKILSSIYGGSRAKACPMPPSQELLLEIQHEEASVNSNPDGQTPTVHASLRKQI